MHGVCIDTASQSQLPGTAFLPSQANLGAGDQFPLTPGQDGSGTIGRNTRVNSSTPLSRILSTRNPGNFVNSGRTSGSRMGQLVIRLVF